MMSLDSGDGDEVMKGKIERFEDGNPKKPTSSKRKRGCQCMRTKCVKELCGCFQSKVGCTNDCLCEGCENFYGKNGSSKNPTSARQSRRGKNGCKCKLSKCTNWTCGCRKIRVGCSDECRCVGCENFYGIKGDAGSSSSVGNEVSLLKASKWYHQGWGHVYIAWSVQKLIDPSHLSLCRLQANRSIKARKSDIVMMLRNTKLDSCIWI